MIQAKAKNFDRVFAKREKMLAKTLNLLLNITSKRMVFFYSVDKTRVMAMISESRSRLDEIEANINSTP